MMRKVKESVVYSEEFRKVVLQAYPDSPKIKELLDSNAHFLGRYLDDGCCASGMLSVPIDKIIVAKDTGKQLELFNVLYTMANREKLRLLAYKMWGDQWYED
ncbi:MAG: hypothetical protein WC102_01675 [Saccharofermentanales bacterium]